MPTASLTPRAVRPHGPVDTPIDRCPGCIDLISNSLLPAAQEKQAKCEYVGAPSHLSHVASAHLYHHSMAAVLMCSCGALRFGSSAQDLRAVALAVENVTLRIGARVERCTSPAMKSMLDHVRPAYRKEVTDWDLA